MMNDDVKHTNKHTLFTQTLFTHAYTQTHRIKFHIMKDLFMISISHINQKILSFQTNKQTNINLMIISGIYATKKKEKLSIIIIIIIIIISCHNFIMYVFFLD